NTAIKSEMVGLGRVELPTSRLSGVRSNHLSYKPLQKNQAGKRGVFLGGDEGIVKWLNGAENRAFTASAQAIRAPLAKSLGRSENAVPRTGAERTLKYVSTG